MGHSTSSGRVVGSNREPKKISFNNIPESISDFVNETLAMGWDEDETTEFEVFSQKEITRIKEEVETSLSNAGINGTLSIRKKKVAGSRSKVKGVSNPATWETRVKISIERS